MSYRRQARTFFFAKLGRVPGAGDIAALAAEFEATELRGVEAGLRTVELSHRLGEASGETIVLALVGKHLGHDAAGLIAEKLLQGRSVTQLDGVAQPTQQVTDDDGAAALPTGGH